MVIGIYFLYIYMYSIDILKLDNGTVNQLLKRGTAGYSRTGQKQNIYYWWKSHTYIW